MGSKVVDENSGLGAHNTTNVHKGEASPGERLSTSSSSSSEPSEFAFEDPLPADKFEHRSSIPKHEQSEQGLHLKQASSLSGATTTSGPDAETGSTLQSPPLQVMEQPADSSEYRIPSYVFARNKSGTPMEWSTASNESLFSIHTGNMSFTREQFNWLLKSGELNYADFKSGQIPSMQGDPPKSGEQILTTPNDLGKPGEQITPVQLAPPPACQSSAGLPSGILCSDSGAANSPAGAHKEELKLETGDRRKGRSSVGEETQPLSACHSNASGQSFAFPVLTSEIDRTSSAKSGTDRTAEQQQKAPQEEPPQPSTRKPEGAQTSSSWLSCFSCCACCS
ncbi:hypothetical protein Ancab_038787 [Ancistrocladus abbreviatus]